jgi:hypothetical protein
LLLLLLLLVLDARTHTANAPWSPYTQANDFAAYNGIIVQAYQHGLLLRKTGVSIAAATLFITHQATYNCNSTCQNSMVHR